MSRFRDIFQITSALFVSTRLLTLPVMVSSVDRHRREMAERLVFLRSMLDESRRTPCSEVIRYLFELKECLQDCTWCRLCTAILRLFEIYECLSTWLGHEDRGLVPSSLYHYQCCQICNERCNRGRSVAK